MKKFKLNLKTLLAFAILLITFTANLQGVSAQTNSKDGSKIVTVKKSVIDDCGKALDELEAQDKVIEAQDKLIKALTDRIETEKEKSAVALELAESRRREAEAYKSANDANKDAIAAKNQIISNKDKEIEILKKRKSSVFDGIKKIAAGVAIGLIVKNL